MQERDVNYAGYSDDELIDRLRCGESAIMDYICDKYKYVVRSKAKTMFILGGDNEDLIQEGMIGLFKAVRDYDIGRDASFHTFAELCIDRQMYTAIQAAQRKKHAPLNDYISLDGSVGGAEGETGGIPNLYAERTEQNPEEFFLDKERMDYLKKAMEEKLSDFEKQVFDLHMTGMTYSQIAKVLGRDEKATDNALQRAKSKIKKML